ncbi:MAG: NADH-quinone oxidoreductase subunit N [Chloroflexi bacterium]|nr:NADH-quinone oxidoreductase subunit N [Chloroflexota bacterium]MBI3734155.1 NADH-quinone oxidoreductase subunit N [Chloroflexota bacterium]
MPIPSIDFTVILPILILSCAALFVLLLDLFLSAERRGLNAYVSLAGVAAAAAATSLQIGRSGTTLEGMAVLDGFGLAFEWLLLGIAALSVLFSIPYVQQHNLNRGEYYVLMLFVTAGGMVMATSNDLITIFLGYELLSLSLYVLAAFARERAASGEAGMKYLLLGGFASAFLLYGIALTFGTTGTTNLTMIAAFFDKTPIAGNALPLIGLALLLIGFGFKIAAAPFHAWAPDVYEGAPTSVTAFMSSAAKVAGFAALARVLFVAFPSPALRLDWGNALAALAILTMTVGNIAALLQNNIKRLLAYSGIAHAGYILIALVTGTAQGLEAALFYLLAYTFMNLGAWSVVIALGRTGEERLDLSDFAGLSMRHPRLAAVMTLFLLSLAGIPPTAGLMGKWLIFSAAIQQNLIPLAVIGVLNSVVSLAYYLRVISLMYTRPADASFSLSPVARPLTVAIVVAAIGTLALGLLPAPVLQWVQIVRF